MEFASHSTNSHNTTGMACKFAKVFKLKSLGVFFSHTNTTIQEKSQSFATASTLSDSDGGCSCDSTEFCQEVGRDHERNNMVFDVEDLFEAISALKLAYVRLQNAHLPYDPLKIAAADESVVMQLEKLSQMKPSFDKIREIKLAESDSFRVGHVSLRVLDDLEAEIAARESQIVRLKRDAQDLCLSNVKMIGKLASGNNEWSNGVGLFGDAYGGVSNAIRDFTKLMILLMRDSGWDLDRAADSIEKSVAYFKRSHKKYAFQAFVARRMFHGFATQSYHRNDSFYHSLTSFEDPINALMDDDPSSPLADFCISKYLLLIHPKLEESVFGNLHHRDMISKGKHPRTTFYKAFAKMARWVWLLRRITALVRPKPQMLGVQRLTKFSGAYMDSIDIAATKLASCNQLRVELMVMPGFRISNVLVKCKAYASTINH